MNVIRNRRVAAGLAVTAVAAAVGTTLGITPVLARDSGHHDGHGAAVRNSGGADVAARGGVAGEPVFFAAGLNGNNEVPAQGGPAVGDKDGKAVQFLRIQGNHISFALKWKGTAAPTAAHIHLGKSGTNGAVKIPFFAEKVPGSLNAVTGSVTVDDPQLLRDLAENPAGFYANLHTAEFPGGAVRGQLHRLSKPVDIDKALSNFQASVVKGEQIYACTKQPDGTYAFAQNNVSAKLGLDIDHSFVKPNAGPPQWIAPDGSAVTGKLISKRPNGVKNIPELDLEATQSGKKHGLLANSVEILRLNTVGGVAPAGSCDPHTQPKAAVPYQADYLFIQR
jgi:hypothetical protein